MASISSAWSRANESAHRSQAQLSRDTLVQGSALVADGDIRVKAGRDLTLTTAQNTQADQSETTDKTTGLLRFEATGNTVGKREQMQAQQNTAVTNTASQIVSLGKGGENGKSGNIDLSAIGNTTITGSSVMAPGGDITVRGANVLINEAQNTTTQASQTRFKETAASVQLKSGYAEAIQGAVKSVEAARTAKEDTGSNRMAALATLNAAASVYNAYQGVSGSAGASSASAAPISAISISGSIGQSKSASNSTANSSTAQGSTVAAGGTLNITAHGDKSTGNGNLTMIGTNASAGKEANLSATGNIDLLAAANTSELRSTNSGSNASMGATFALGGQQNGLSFQAGAQGSKGKANGDETTYSNTQIRVGSKDAPGTLNISSGGNTTLKGATASANTVNADIKGNLTIESLQDKAAYDSKQTSVGAGVSVCVPPLCYGTMVVVNVNAAQAKIDGNLTSVGEQSALRAGDGGFNVKVGGDTTLKGGAITSTQKAIDDKANSFAAGGKLTTSDLQNKSELDASSISASLSTGSGSTSGSMGYGSVKDSRSSTTTASISGIAGNKDARTGDAETGIKPVFTAADAAKIDKSLNVQTGITAEAGRNLPRLVGDVAGSRQRALADDAAKEADPVKRQALLDESARWGEGGIYRVGLHAVAGSLTGGINGALGATAGAAAAPVIEQLQTQLTQTFIDAGMNPQAARAAASVVMTGTSATLGGIAGGLPGAVVAGNVDMNNRQLHPTEQARARQLADASGGKYTAAQIEEQMRLMGNGSLGVAANTTEYLMGDAIPASIVQDPTMPRTASGQVVTEIPGQANAGLQQYIIGNTQNGSGYIPGVSPYTASNLSLNAPVVTNTPTNTGPITARCGLNDLACRSGVGAYPGAPSIGSLSDQTREGIADGANSLSRQAGVVTAGATAITQGVPPQVRPITGAVAVGATAIGFTADVVEQVVRPDLRQVLREQFILGVPAEVLMRRFPHAAPLINEIKESLK